MKKNQIRTVVLATKDTKICSKVVNRDEKNRGTLNMKKQ